MQMREERQAFDYSTRGFTIIELLVSVGVLALISGIGITIFIAISASYDKASVISNVSREGNRVMESLARTVRSSFEVDAINPQRIRLSIPREDTNLEYANNGKCDEIDVFYDSVTSSIKKSVSPASVCGSTPRCPISTPCTLTTSDVNVTAFTVTVTDNDDAPDSVDLTFTIQQDPSLSDPEQQASQEFSRVVLTRGY